MSLTVREVSLRLGDGDQQVIALNHVSLNVANGELLAVLGPSGAGKSSLLAVCGGLRRPESGQVLIDDTDITTLDQAALARVRREKVGFVFQQSNLVPALTALEQLLLLPHLRGQSLDAAQRERARMLLVDVGMEQRMDRRPHQLSGGERQRVGIARALMGEPALMLVDEPTSMLDQQRGAQIVELLATQCHRHRVAVLMVTHDRQMLAVADRAVHIRDGQLEDQSHATAD